MKGLTRILSRLGVSYERYRIFELRISPAPQPVSSCGSAHIVPLDRHMLETSPVAEIQALAGYAGPEAIGFGALVDDRIVAACWYWFGDRYRTRGFIQLPPRAAKLVQVTTAADWRRRGIAATLIAESAQLMAAHGFESLYARVWHSHHASASTFLKAGWRECDMVTTLRVPPFQRLWRFPSGRSPRIRQASASAAFR